MNQAHDRSVRRITVVFAVILSIFGQAANGRTAPTKAVAPTWSVTTGGCKVWNPDPQPDEVVEWSGACVDGFATGPGTEKWLKAGSPSNILTGTLENGRFKGEVRVEYPNGSVYVGQLGENGPDGARGVYSFASGAKYIGSFKNGKRDGYGTYFDGTGQIAYQGFWKAGKFLFPCTSVCLERYQTLLGSKQYSTNDLSPPAGGSSEIAILQERAQAGDPAAQYDLGQSYERGSRVPQSYVYAHLWFNLSAAFAQDPQIRSLATRARDAVATRMTLEQIGEAQRLASVWKPKKTDH